MTDYEKRQTERISEVWLRHPFLSKMKTKGEEIEKKLLQTEKVENDKKWQRKK